MIEKTWINHISEGCQISDEEMWVALKEGDKNALEQLFCRYYEDLFQYALKMSGHPEMAEDCIQDLFLEIWRRRNHLSEVKGVKTYLWTALRRSLIIELRNKKKNRRLADKRRLEPISAMKLNAEELIIKKELDIQIKKQLAHAMDQLSARHREVLYLKFYEGMSYDEIEQIVSISCQTARNYVSEAFKVLKVFMTGSTQDV